jgi:Holliday junction resolvase RusA-like endonuclease
MLENIIRPTKKPDADNIAKIVCDALNGIAFLDDKQIVDARITKWYSDTPRIEIIIQEIE